MMQSNYLLPLARRAFTPFDQLFHDVLDAASSGAPVTQPRARAFPMDLHETGEALVASLELPGADIDSLSVTISEGVLRVSGDYKTAERQEDDRVHFTERRRGSFERALSLPADVDVEAVDASYADGVLTIVMPKAVEAADPVHEVAVRRT